MRAEAHSFSLWKLWDPFIFLALPAMFLTASVAVLFETLPVLRGGVGNVIYFFLWTAAIAMGATGLDDPSDCNSSTAVRIARSRPSIPLAATISISASPSVANVLFVPFLGTESIGPPTCCSCACSGWALPPPSRCWRHFSFTASIPHAPGASKKRRPNQHRRKREPPKTNPCPSPQPPSPLPI